MRSPLETDSAPISTVYDSLHSLPRFYGAKFFVLIDKICNVFTELSAGMVQATDHTFNAFPDSELEANLKNSKAFKSWHRSMEDLIDETGENFRSKLSELSQIYGSVSSEGKEVKAHMASFISQLQLKSSGRLQKKTAEALYDLARIIESSNILESADLEGSRMAKTTRRNLAGAEDESVAAGGSPKFAKKDLEPKDSQLRRSNSPGKKEEPAPPAKNRVDQPSNDSFREATPVVHHEPKLTEKPRTVNKPREKGTDEPTKDDDGQLIKNVRITKGIIGSHSRPLSPDYLYHIVLSYNRDFVVVAGKDIPLTKYTFDSFEKLSETDESRPC